MWRRFNRWAVGLLALCALALAACGPDLALLNSPDGLTINDLIITSANDGWAVGLQPGRSQPVLLHEQHGIWQADANPPPTVQGDALRAVALSGTTLWVAGARSDATHGDSTQESGFAFARGADGKWQRQSFGAPINAMTFVSPQEGWAVGDGGAIYHDLNGTWTQSPNSMDNILYDVAFRAPNDGWAVGEMGMFLHYDGTGWHEPTHFTHEDILSVALSANDGWAVGTEGTLIELDSSGEWIEIAAPITVTVTLRGVAIQDGNVWVVGDSGLVFERTAADSQWHHIPPPANAQLNTITITLTGDAWVGGTLANSTLYHFTSGSWRDVAISLATASSSSGS